MMTTKASKFLALSSTDRRLIVQAWVFQMAAGFLLKAVPFRAIPRYFRNPVTAAGEGTGTGVNPELLSSIRSALIRTSPYVWWRNRCLVQSLAARWILKKRGIMSHLYLGLAKDADKKTVAHAWIKVGENEIVSKNGNYVELFDF